MSEGTGPINYQVWNDLRASAEFRGFEQYTSQILSVAPSLQPKKKFGLFNVTNKYMDRWVLYYTAAVIRPCILKHKVLLPYQSCVKKLKKTVDDFVLSAPNLNEAYNHLGEYWKLRSNGRNPDLLTDVCEVNSSWVGWMLYGDDFNMDNKESFQVSMLIQMLLHKTAMASVELNN